MSKKKANSRKFTAFIPHMLSTGLQEQLLLLFCAFLFLLLVALVGTVYLSSTILTRSYAERSSRVEQYEHWMTYAAQHGNSPDVLYNAAVSAVAVKKYQTAVELLDKALTLDPRFEKALSLRRTLEDTY